jgi:uncharacterized protein (DUF427 family)
VTASPGFAARPDYRVDLLARRNRFEVHAGDVLLASSDGCLVVDEQDHGLVVYFPRDAVRLDRLEPSEHVTHCPYKGDAAHWQLPGGDQPVAWCYEEPYDEVARIAGRIAFYQDRVSLTMGVATPAVSGR